MAAALVRGPHLAGAVEGAAAIPGGSRRLVAAAAEAPPQRRLGLGLLASDAARAAPLTPHTRPCRAVAEAPLSACCRVWRVGSVGVNFGGMLFAVCRVCHSLCLTCCDRFWPDMSVGKHGELVLHGDWGRALTGAAPWCTVHAQGRCMPGRWRHRSTVDATQRPVPALVYQGVCQAGTPPWMPSGWARA